MAKKFSEITKKAEDLLEQGREAEETEREAEAGVAAAQSAVAAAQSQLAAASQTDDEGNPRGDVQSASADLRVAEGRLAASERALEAAQRRSERIRQEKDAHVREIDRHNETSRSNLERLRRLESMSFAEDSRELIEGIASRLNEAEDARVALLRSMGIDAAPDYVTVGEAGGSSSGWSSGGLEGVPSSDANKEGLPSGGAPAPPGGGLREPSFSAASQSGMSAGGAQGTGAVDKYVDELLSAGDLSSAPELTKAIVRGWMDTFNPDERKSAVSEKEYQAGLETFRKGIAACIGKDAAASLSTQDIEKVARIQSMAHREGCMLDNNEVSELYRNAVAHNGNFVTRKIEYKMDRVLQERAFDLLKTAKFSKTAWYGARSTEERKQMLGSLISELNSIFGTSVSTKVVPFYDDPSTRGLYSRSTNSVHINENLLAQEFSYQAVITTIHEMRHAYQHHSCENEESVLVSSETIGKWRKNFVKGNYVRNGDGYFSQPVEWDAKNFAMQYDDLRGIKPDYRGSW